MPLPLSAVRALAVLVLAGLPLVAAAQPSVVFFDENDDAGDDYRDASFGRTEGGDVLRLAGPGAEKWPLEDRRAYRGTVSGRLAYRHVAGGSWNLFVARRGWQPADLTALDTLVLLVNGPAVVPAAELPRLGLEDASGNTKTDLVALAGYLDGLDGDAATWQRVAVPLDAFAHGADFSMAEVKTVRFADGGVTAAERTLWVDLIHAVAAGGAGPEAPRALVTRAGDRSVILHWGAVAGAAGYHVERREAATDGPFERLTTRPVDGPHFTDFDVANGTDYVYAVRAVDGLDRESPPSEPAAATPRVLDDEAFVDLVQRASFDYFWYEGHPETGLQPDRAPATNFCSIATTGFGLTAYGVGVERGWIPREAAAARTLTTLRTLWHQPQGTAAAGTIGHRGFFYHFLRCDDATRFGTSELSTVDTALLLGGVLYARQFFDGPAADEAEIRALADSIYRRVDWPWAQVRGALISHGWHPESGFIPYDWGGYNEAMIVYVLALGSPTHPVEPEAWQAWTDGYADDWRTLYGETYLTFPPLFGHQYSHLWIDFRDRRDAFMRARGLDYFENSVRAVRAARAYAIANPGGFPNYGPDEWGLTASTGPDGYTAYGAPPAQHDDGTLAPTALGGSYAFAPDLVRRALRHLYDRYRTRLWGPYGFLDAFNVRRDWFADVYLGLDQGPFVLMIENARTEHVWDVAMTHPALRRGLERAGFEPVGTSTRPTPEAPSLRLSAPSPNPFGARTTLRYALPQATDARLVVYDLLGRKVAMLVDGHLPPGEGAVVLDAARLPAGLYLARLETPTLTRTVRLVRLR